jgi:hypothetical protein
MALVSFLMGDCTSAVSFANKVLSYTPDPSSSDDPWESGTADAITREGERLASEALNDPGAIGSWKQVQQEMKTIKDACQR